MLYAQIDALLARARQGAARPFEVVQAIGADRVRALLPVLRELRIKLEDDLT